MEGCSFLERVRDALAVARLAGVPVIVNDRVDVALAAGADGVHIGQDDLPCLEVPSLLLLLLLRPVFVDRVRAPCLSFACGVLCFAGCATFKVESKVCNNLCSSYSLSLTFFNP